MCTTKLSPTPLTGAPSADWSMPELSMETCPCGSRRTAKIAAGSASMVRWTSIRSLVMEPSCQLLSPGSGRRFVLPLEEVVHQCGEDRRLLGEAQMGGILDDLELRAGQPAVHLGQVPRRALVVPAAD